MGLQEKNTIENSVLPLVTCSYRGQLADCVPPPLLLWDTLLGSLQHENGFLVSNTSNLQFHPYSIPFLFSAMLGVVLKSMHAGQVLYH